MTTTEHQLTKRLAESLGSVRISEVGDTGAYVAQLPTGRMAHDFVQVVVEPDPDGGWMLSDGEATSRLLGEDFTEIVGDLRCGGAPFDVSGEQLIARVATDNLAESILSFGHHLSAVPVVWHISSCKRSDVQQPGSRANATSEMIDRTVEAITARLPQPHMKAYLARNQTIHNKGESVRFPLIVARPSGRIQPRLASTFIDLNAGRESVKRAKIRTAWLFEVISDYKIPKYIVARGAVSQVGHIASVFDRGNVSVVADSDVGRLADDAAEAIAAVA